MRLVCPSCEAKYEVPEDAIPDSGRDVQCANCGHGWFQMRPKPVPMAPPVPAASEKPKAGNAKPPKAADLPAATADLTPPRSAVKDDAAELPGGDPETEREPPARVPNEKVLTILREEAEREAKARREKTRPLEAQPELGIDNAAAAPRKPPPKQPEPEPEIELKIAARRDLLPDVEEIKSTLQPSEVEEPEFADGSYGEMDRREGRRPFRAGFLCVITVAILAASVYISTPWLSAKLPALADPLASYVSAVDELRLELDGLMRKATLLISGEES